MRTRGHPGDRNGRCTGQHRRAPRLPWLISFGLLAAAACSSPPPTAEDIASQELPVVSLDAPARERVTAHVDVALTALRRGGFDEALASARAALELDPREPRARAVLARTLAEAAQAEQPADLGGMQRAEGEARRATAMAPNDPVVALLHAQVLELDGHLSAAAVRVERTLAAAPRDVALLREAARLRYELGEERAARALLLDLLVEAPHDRAALYRLAQCWVELAAAMPQGSAAQRSEKEQGFSSAANAFASYRALASEDPAGWLGEAHARLEAWRVAQLANRESANGGGDGQPAEPDPSVAARLQDVLQLYEAAAALEPADPAADFGRGVVLELLGRDAAARDAYRAALARDPDHVPSLLNLAASLAANGDASAARSLAARALQLGVQPFERRRLEEWLARRPERDPGPLRPATRP